ncbi:SBBP repeat-containing protein [Vitiosangium sp. GDMCC 1.1324]|uniref:SBBP repeat-containing protein n=1 Tax=Vitiosangium sp. (strain GDMCC 1.1324) TaxID=2138576 RepID=UPI0011B430D0|nr:SBBP repeat-containing protein [Vitiosangium sp. GDMCC 1.1324]
MRTLCLASSLILASTPGCKGEELPAEGAELEGQSSTQTLTCGNTVNLVPVMTSATSPSGIVTRSGAYSSSYEAWQAFDNSNTMWISAVGQTPAQLGYEWQDGAKTITHYAFTFANGSLTSRAPKNWTLEAWTGSAWTVIDTRTNQTGWAGFEQREFAVTSPGAYSKYRLSFTDDNDTRTGVEVISLARVELKGCSGQADWTRTIGVSGAWTQGMSLAGDPAGRSYIAGMTTGAVNGSPMLGAMDAYVRAYDWTGNLIWAHTLGAPNAVAVSYGIATNRTWEEIYAVGYSGGGIDGNPPVGGTDAFITNIRYTGVKHWTRVLGVSGGRTEAYGVAVDASNNSFVVGSVNNGLDGNTLTGNWDLFVTKYDPNGIKLWTRQLGVAGGTTIARRAATDDAGNVYVAGWTTGNLDGVVKNGPQDVFVTKYNGAGVKQWTRLLGAAGTSSWTYGAAADAAGNFYVTGYTGGDLDGNPAASPNGFLTKYDSAGNKQWTRQFGSGATVWGTGVVINANGVFAGGLAFGDASNPTSTGSASHLFVARYDTAGNALGVVQQPPASLGGVDKDVFAYGLSIDANGNYYLGGSLYGNYGGNLLQGNPDAFVTMLPH